MCSYVYVLPLADLTAFKVGKSDNPKKRVGTLSCYYEFNLELDMSIHDLTPTNISRKRAS